MHHREGLSPVPLAREQPIAELVRHLPDANALLFDQRNRTLLGFRRAEPVEDAAVAGDTLARKRQLATLDDPHNGEVELAGKGVVAVVVTGHRHDGARAVADEHIVRDPDGDLRARQGIHGVGAGEDTRLLLLGRTIHVGAVLRHSHVGGHIGIRRQRLKERVLWSDDTEGRA